MSQHELGITFVSVRQLQGSTKFLGKVCQNTLAATPETVQEEHQVTKYWLLLMKGLEQWCLLKDFVLCWCCTVLCVLSPTGRHLGHFDLQPAFDTRGSITTV